MFICRGKTTVMGLPSVKDVESLLNKVKLDQESTVRHVRRLLKENKKDYGQKKIEKI